MTYEYKEDILIYYNKYFNKLEQVPSTLIKNEYYRDYNFNYVKNTDNFIPSNQQDILNIYYTVINSGMEEFTFYCSEEYEDCLQDVKDIADNQVIVSNINNFVHPYNGFENIETEFDTLGKITLKIKRNYTKEMQIILDYKVDEIIKNNITDDMSLEEKIKTIHDYIINNTKYDEDRSDDKIIKYKSNTAYGPLIEGYAICSGYTDSMILFLEEFGIKNHKISSEHHVWNSVYLNNKWYNLDLTWDDPVSQSGKDTLDHSFFLITSDEMEQLDTSEHKYDKNVYSN